MGTTCSNCNPCRTGQEKKMEINLAYVRLQHKDRKLMKEQEK